MHTISYSFSERSTIRYAIFCTLVGRMHVWLRNLTQSRTIASLRKRDYTYLVYMDAYKCVYVDAHSVIQLCRLVTTSLQRMQI